MKNYKVIGIITRLTAGLVKISGDQIRRRIHNLKKVGDGEYEIVNPIEFKNGEVFGHDGDLSKVPSVIVMGDEADANTGSNDDTTDTTDTSGDADELKELSVTSLKKLTKPVLFAGLPQGHRLVFANVTKADIIAVIKAG